MGMIYILTEQVMNGTVTMKSNTTLIEADNFDSAYKKLQGLPNWNMATNIYDTDNHVGYTISGDMLCYGTLYKKPARVI
jgi:hypothetical protein